MEFDFDTAKQRIEQAIARLEGREDAQMCEEILRERARRLASRARRRLAPRTDQDSVIAFRRGERVFGIRTQRVVRMQSMYVCALRFGPPAVIGLAMEGSEPLSVIDIVRPVRPITDGAKALVAHCMAASGPLAIAIDEVLGPRTLTELRAVTHVGVAPFIEGRTDDDLWLISFDVLADWPDIRVR